MFGSGSQCLGYWCCVSGDRIISWSMNTLQSSSRIEALCLGPSERPHIPRIVPFIYRNYTQFYFTDSLSSWTCIIDSHLNINLESFGQANKSLIKPKWQPELGCFPSKCQGGVESNKCWAASSKGTKVFTDTWQPVCFSLFWQMAATAIVWTSIQKWIALTGEG